MNHAGAFSSGRVPVVAFVNNTADRALGNTERQFLGLLRSALVGRDIHVAFYTCPEIRRATRPVSAHGEPYQDIRHLYETRPDALIVTGMEPQACSLPDEPVFRSLGRLAEWAEDQAILPHYGHAWRRMRRFCTATGFRGCACGKSCPACSPVTFENTAHPLAAGLPTQLSSPHSRFHTLPAAALRAAGYDILSRSEVTGVDVFAKNRGAPWLFFQGHPEYDAETLLLEYRRDVRRYLLGASEHYPSTPQKFFDGRTEEALASMRRDGRHEIAALQSVLDRAQPMPRAAWHTTARLLYANWLDLAMCPEAAGPALPAGAMSPGCESTRAAVLRP